MPPPPAAETASARQLRRIHPPKKTPPVVITPFDDDDSWRLFVTTNSQICAWDRNGCEPIFTSSSHGIVAARRAQNGSTLAIADAQVVMIHHIANGQNKSYRLKGTQRCRLLQYSHDSRNLFYTDALHNSVQNYSLSENRVSDAAKSHPSPVIAFTVSCDSNLILSVSENPPTIQIHNQMMATTVSIVPTASSAAVVSCTFHPTRKHIFVLAFKDGVVGAFDYTALSKGKQVQENPNGVVRRQAKAIHAFKHLHEPSIAGSAGVTGVQFIPGQRSRAITVGEDGRCFLIDFEQGTTVGSWHIGAPATSVTLRQVTAGQGRDMGGYLIAIGTVHGRCIIYDGNANRIADRRIDPDGDAVLDVEWVHGEVNVPDGGLKSPAPSPTKAPKEHATRFRKHNPSIALHSSSKRPPAEHAPLEETDGNLIEDTPTARRYTLADFGGSDPPASDPLEEAADHSYMMLFSPVKKRRSPKPSSLPEEKPKLSSSNDRRTSSDDPAAEKPSRSAISAPQLWSDKPTSPDPVADKSPQKPPQPSHPKVPREPFSAFQSDSPQETIRPVNLPSKPPSPTTISKVASEHPKVTDTTSDGQLLSEIRSIRTKVENSRAARNSSLALIAPYLPSRVRTTPASRADVPTDTNNDTLRRSKSAPETKLKKRVEPSNTVPSSDPAGSESVEPASEPITQDGFSEYERDSTPVLGDGHVTGVEAPASAGTETDIWLVDTSARLARKRKKAAALGSDGTVQGDGVSTRSAKSRKTVSFSEARRENTGREGSGREKDGRGRAKGMGEGNAGGTEETVRRMHEEMVRMFEGMRGEITELRKEVGALREENTELRDLLRSYIGEDTIRE